MSGQKLVEGKWQECAYLHPRVCDRLLREGDKGRGGCKGGCDKLHTKMCFSSMNTKTCVNEDCRKGYHVRGTKKAERKSTMQLGQKALPAAGGVVNYPPLGTARGPWGATTPSSPKTPAPAPASFSFLEVQTMVRQEMVSFLQELKATINPPAPATAPFKEKAMMGYLLRKLRRNTNRALYLNIRGLYLKKNRQNLNIRKT